MKEQKETVTYSRLNAVGGVLLHTTKAYVRIEV